MKVLLVNKFHYNRGGGAVAYLDMAEILKEKGHEIAFFSTRQEKNFPTKWSKYFVPYYDLAGRHGFLTKLKIVSKIFYNFEAKKRIRQLIKDFQPDIAHLHNIYHHLSPSIISELKKNKIPTVMTLHDYKLISPNYNLFSKGEIWEGSKRKKYYRCVLDKCVKNSYWKSLVSALEAYWHNFLGIYKKVDVFIAPSRFLKNKFKEYGFSGKIVHLPNPLLMEEPNTEPVSGNDYILYSGRLSREKGLEILFRAYADLDTDLKLILVGDGPEKEKLQKLAKKLNIKNKVEFAGHRSRKEVFSYIKGAKLAVFPSVCYENLPYSILEAMHLKKIVICANIGGIKDMVGNGENGFLYDHKDYKDLKQKMEKVLYKLSPERKKNIEEEAEKTVKNKNGKEKFYQNLMEIYKQILNNK